jgi:CRISPR/Cas system endoribonuclease Cas6 (RAMP superfamily)
MDIQAQKIELIQMLLSTTKPNIIKKIKAVFEEANVNAVINSSMTVAQLEKEIEEAEADIKAGRTYSTKQVKAHFKN